MRNANFFFLLFQYFNLNFVFGQNRFIIQIPNMPTFYSSTNSIFTHHPHYHLCLVFIRNQRINSSIITTLWTNYLRSRHTRIKNIIHFRIIILRLYIIKPLPFLNYFSTINNSSPFIP